jgi:hypothetical protein
MFRTLPEASGARVRVNVDGIDVEAWRGEPLAAVLLRTPPYTARTTASGALRGPYCLIGACFDCLAIVDGVPSRRTCMVAAADGMRVERQRGKRVQQP